MMSSQEVALRNQIQHLKARMKEMEELFEFQDEESRQLIQELKSENMSLSRQVSFPFIHFCYNTVMTIFQVQDMEKMIADLNFEKADLAQQLDEIMDSPREKETSNIHKTFTLSDSMAEHFDDLNQRIDALEVEKVTFF